MTVVVVKGLMPCSGSERVNDTLTVAVVKELTAVAVVRELITSGSERVND